MSGISTHTCLLSNALSEQYPTSAILMRRLIPRRLYPGRDRVGADITTMRYRDEVTVYDGVDYFWIPSLFGAIRTLVRERPTVMVFQWWSGTVVHSFLALAAVGRLLGARIVIEFHETLDTAEADIPFIGTYVKYASRPLIAMTSAAAVHSSTDIEPVRERFPGLRDKPVDVVILGPQDITADPGRWTSGRAAGEVTELLFFGTIRPYKGLEHLVQAFGTLTPEQAARFRLTVVGETWQGWDLPKRLIESSPHRDRITFVNTYVTDEQVAQYFRDADAMVLPYVRSSGSGPLHLAMSHGLPVAVTAVGGLVEAVADYSGARLVRPEDIADLAQALLELPDMPGPHADPHSWATVDGVTERTVLVTPGPRLVLASRGDPLVPHLHRALRQRYTVVDEIDVELKGVRRARVAALTVRPTWTSWATSYTNSNLGFDARTALARTRLAAIDADFDTIVQTHTLFGVRDERAVVYVDCTYRQALRGWPDWTLRSGRARRRWMASEQTTYREARHLFAFTGRTRDSLIEDYGVEPERITVVGSGVNFDGDIADRDAAPRDPVVLLVGKQFRRKGVDTVLDAFAQARRAVPGARLQIVGTPLPGPVPDGVEVLGVVDDRARMAELYRAASVFALASRFDPAPMVVLEAMAYGLPCVVSREASHHVRALVDDRHAGWVTGDEDVRGTAEGLITLLRDPDLAYRLGSSAQQAMRTNYRWSDVVGRMSPALSAVSGEFANRS